MTKKKKYITVICIVLAAIVAGLLAFLLIRNKDVIDHIPAKSKAVVVITPSNEETGEALQQLMRNIVNLNVEGLDFTEPSYVFITPNEYYGMAIKVDNKDKVAQSFPNQKIEEGDGAQWLWFGDAWQLCWTDDVFLALGPSTIEDQAHIRRTLSIMLDASADEGFGHTDRYKQMMASDGDIRLFSKLEVIPMPYNLPFKMCIPDTCEAEKVLIYANAKNEGGKWLADCNITSEDEDILRIMDTAEKKNTQISTVEPEGVGCNNLLFMAGNAEYGQLSKIINKDNTMQMLFASFNDSTNVKQKIKEMTGGYSFCIENIDKNLHAACLLTGKTKEGSPVVIESKKKLSEAAFEGAKISEQVKGLKFYFHLNFLPLQNNKALQEKHPTLVKLFGNIKSITYKATTNRTAKTEVETYQK